MKITIRDIIDLDRSIRKTKSYFDIGSLLIETAFHKNDISYYADMNISVRHKRG